MQGFFNVHSFYDYASNGTAFTDSFGRVWEKRVQYGQGFLIGITKDTPSFTDQQIKGIVIDGFRVLPSQHEEDDSHKRSITSRFLRRR